MGRAFERMDRLREENRRRFGIRGRHHPRIPGPRMKYVLLPSLSLLMQG
jgi:hypothetical protein